MKKSEVVVVTSGKGGVGKSTTSASFALGLAMKGFKTCVIDFDVGLRNLDLLLNCENRVVYDFVNVVQEEATLTQALIKDKRSANLSILAASQTRDKDVLTKEGVGKVINELKEMGFRYIIADSPAGIEAGALHALYWADRALIVTNPEISSVRDSDRILGILASKSLKAEQGETIEENLVLTRYNPERVESGEMLSVNDVSEILNIPLLGVIPESKDVLNASNSGRPVILEESADASIAYKDLVERFIGGDVPHKFLSVEKKGFLKRLLG